MFENFSTALIQLVGFFGVFGFFVYQLLTDKKNERSDISSGKTEDNKSKKDGKSGLFARRKKEVIGEPSKNRKTGWFK